MIARTSELGEPHPVKVGLRPFYGSYRLVQNVVWESTASRLKVGLRQLVKRVGGYLPARRAASS